MASESLSGVKVVELCEMVAGPYCTKLMADLGAEVIKIERPGSGDPARMRGPFLHDIPNPETSGLFLYANTNKLGVTLNLEDAKGREILKELIKDADILIEDRPPGALDKLKLGYNVLKKVNPRLIMESITPYGQTGPYRNYNAYPLNIFHGCGEGYVTPGQNMWPDRPPLKIGKYVGEYEAGIEAAVPVIIALYYQRATGQGQYIDSSKQESLITMGTMELTRYPNTGELPTRGTRGYRVAGFMQCMDGYVEFCIYTQRDWQGLVQLMGNPEWAKDEKFKSMETRVANADETNQRISEWLMKTPKEYIYQEGQKLKVPVGAYYTPKDLVESGQMKHRGFFTEITHPLAGKLTVGTAAYKMTKTPWQGKRAAPLLGENNQDIYCGRLGYSKENLVRLRGLGVI